MGYKISYAGLPRKEMYERALRDAKDYLNEVQWDTLLKLGVKAKLTRNKPSTLRVRSFYLAAAFAGIQGPPATALLKYAWGHLTLKH